MKEVTLNGIIELSEKEDAIVQKLRDAHSKNLHYFAFDMSLSAFSRLGSWLTKNRELHDNSNVIINALCEKGEVCSLYPSEKLTLYPIKKVIGGGYEIDFTNNDKNFEDILELNDNTYKTEYMIVDFGHIANNFNDNYCLIIESLKELLDKSDRLKAIYLDVDKDVEFSVPVNRETLIKLLNFLYYIDEKTNERLSDDDAYFNEVAHAFINETARIMTPEGHDAFFAEFGIADGVYMSLDELVEKFGGTREQIRQLVDTETRKLKHPFRRNAILLKSNSEADD